MIFISRDDAARCFVAAISTLLMVLPTCGEEDRGLAST